MLRHATSLLVASAALFAGCTAVHDDLSRQILQPPGMWLVEPADFGIDAEAFEIGLHEEASLTGFWIPSSRAAGRTVVLLHEETVNASAVHPYYRFLHGAGFHVLVLDPRGYGKSLGQPTLRAWIHDLDEVFAWLRERPEVDAQKIALFGTSMGSLAAMWAVRMHPECKAVVFEHLPSIRDMLREAMNDDGSALSAYSIGAMEFGLPENLEPTDNAPFGKARALFIATERELERDRLALLRAFDAYAGDKDLWVVPEAGRAPHAMLTHDGVYEWRIAAFLAAALDDSPNRVTAAGRKVRDASDGQSWYEFELVAAGDAPTAPWAAEACAVLPDGSPHFAATRIEGERGRVRMKLPGQPAWIAAQRLFASAADAQAAAARASTWLSRSGAAIAALWPRIEEVRHGQAAIDACRSLGLDLQLAGADEAFHPTLETELADVFARIGLALAKSADPADHAEAETWLRRAVDTVPKYPRAHFWPGPVPTYGFPQRDAVEQARQALL